MAINAKLIVAGTEKDSDMFYATRFHAPDRFTLLMLGQRKIAITGDLEFERMKKESTIDEIVLAAELAKDPRYPSSGHFGPTNPFTVLQLLRNNGVEVAEVPADFPASLAYFLMANGIVIRPREWSGGESAFFPEREVKDQKEVSYIEATQGILEEEFLMA